MVIGDELAGGVVAFAFGKAGEAFEVGEGNRERAAFWPGPDSSSSSPPLDDSIWIADRPIAAISEGLRSIERSSRRSTTSSGGALRNGASGLGFLGEVAADDADFDQPVRGLRILVAE